LGLIETFLSCCPGVAWGLGARVRGGRPSTYSRKFKRKAVALVRSTSRPINQVARELGRNDLAAAREAASRGVA
jgi:transposase-like protein